MKKTLKIILLIVVLYNVIGLLLYVVKFDRKCERIFIPEDYRGIFVVVHQYPHGLPRDYYGWCREYRIPDDGVLLTRFKSNPGWMQSKDNIKVYLTDEEGNSVVEAKWRENGNTQYPIDEHQVYFKFIGYVKHGTHLLNLRSYSYGIFVIDEGVGIRNYSGTQTEIEKATTKAVQKILAEERKMDQ
ncbi:MAG: hypothetical protein R2795_14995 [Saprospiraceae bacterium]